MKKSFDDILDICLERITVKGDSIEQCLESYPEQAAELEPLLRAASYTVGVSSAIEPRPEFQRLTKQLLFSALEVKKEKRTGRRMPLWGWQRRWAVAITVVLVLILIGVGTVSASASSLPGDTLYPVKTATEKVQGFFTMGSEAKASFHMKIAQRRMDELKLLAESNRNIPQSLLTVMGTETDGAIEILSQKTRTGNESVDRLMRLTFKQKTLLIDLMEKVPSKAKLKLQEALMRSEHARDRAQILKNRMQHINE